MDDKIELMTKEYETLRQESLDSMNNRSQVISFGLATIGLIFAAVFSLDAASQSKQLILLIFSAGIPIISIMILYIWLGEVERMMRAGEYLCGLEARINSMFETDDPPLRWEWWLRTSGKQMRYPYIMVIGLFFGLAFFAPVVGFFAKGFQLQADWWALIAPWGSITPFVVHVYLRARKLK